MILNADLEKPVVRRSFRLDNSHGSIHRQPGATTKVPFVPYDKNLFSLGIVRVELWFGKRLQDLADHQDEMPNDNTDSSDWETANRLLVLIEQQAGKICGDAVSRCIRGLDYSATSLDDDGFKSEVELKVVSELERNWQAYVSLDG